MIELQSITTGWLDTSETSVGDLSLMVSYIGPTYCPPTEARSTVIDDVTN